MSDNVRFLTVNDTVTPANSSGANGFPSPFGTGPTGTGTQNPVKVSLSDAVKWWWRVKNWKLQPSTWSVTDDTPNTFTLTTGDMIPGVGNATRELDLINPNAAAHNFGISSASSQINLFIDESVGGQIQDADFSHVWPELRLPTSFLGDSGKEIDFAFDQSILGTVTGHFAGSIDGYAVDIYYDASSTHITSFTVGNMDFVPVEYWPYAALSDGSPIYNTSSGAQLQAPEN